MIKINGVNFKYNEKLVLEDIGFSIEDGTFWGVVGPNGSGKTTLLRLLTGYLIPLSGDVLLNKKNILKYKHKERARKIAVVPQYHLVNQFFTVHQLLEMGRDPYHNFFNRPGIKDKEIIESISKKLDIQSFKNRLLKTLSGGELQRVLIAKALIQDTPIIIMDEPTNHLDIHHQVEVLQMIKDCQRQGRTIIAVFHDLNFAAKFSDKILILDKTIKAIGNPKEVLTEQTLKDVFHTTDFAVNPDLRVVLK
jgi:iron complex transport system ATP-binding protein